MVSSKRPRALLSKLSMWDSPPFMKRKMTCFALGLKFGSLSIQGFAVAAVAAAELGLAASRASA
jgi:hypothetical protein